MVSKGINEDESKGIQRQSKYKIQKRKPALLSQEFLFDHSYCSCRVVVSNVNKMEEDLIYRM